MMKYKDIGLGILSLSVISLIIASLVGMGYATHIVHSKPKIDKDKNVTITFNSNKVPGYNKFILFKIFSVVFWIFLAGILLYIGQQEKDKNIDF